MDCPVSAIATHTVAVVLLDLLEIEDLMGHPESLVSPAVPVLRASMEVNTPTLPINHLVIAFNALVGPLAPRVILAHLDLLGTLACQEHELRATHAMEFPAHPDLLEILVSQDPTDLQVRWGDKETQAFDICQAHLACLACLDLAGLPGDQALLEWQKRDQTDFPAPLALRAFQGSEDPMEFLAFLATLVFLEWTLLTVLVRREVPLWKLPLTRHKCKRSRLIFELSEKEIDILA